MIITLAPSSPHSFLNLTAIQFGWVRPMRMDSPATTHDWRWFLKSAIPSLLCGYVENGLKFMDNQYNNGF